MSTAARAIAVAMKEYGLIVADNGSNWYISAPATPLGRRRTRTAEGIPGQRLRSRQVRCRRPRLLITRTVTLKTRQILPSVARMMNAMPRPIAPRTIRKTMNATIAIGISRSFVKAQGA